MLSGGHYHNAAVVCKYTLVNTELLLYFTVAKREEATKVTIDTLTKDLDVSKEKCLHLEVCPL